jgi:predicted  nucleic acid-binding Zn-ribbon protein
MPSAPTLPDLTPPPSDVPVPSLSGPSDMPTGEEHHAELMTEDIEKIVDSMIEEKSSKLKDELNNLTSWKEDLTKQVGDFKKQLEDLNQKFSDTQNAMVGKVEEYNKSIGDVNVEIQAMGKVFQRLIPEFTENVKKLSDSVNKK